MRDFPVNAMALHDWLTRLKNYGENLASQYVSGAQETEGLPGELAAKRRMMDQARLALGQDTQVAPASAAPAMSPYAPVNNGLTPIGGENALRQLYAGNPPDLRRR